MLLKYRPEDKAAKKERLLKRAQAETEGKTVEAKKPIVVKYGLNHITYLIEQVWFPLNFLTYKLNISQFYLSLESSKILYDYVSEQGSIGCYCS